MTKEFCDFCGREIRDCYVGITVISREPYKFVKKALCQPCQKEGIDFIKSAHKEQASLR